MPIARLQSLELVRKGERASSTDEIIRSHLRVMIWRMPPAEACEGSLAFRGQCDFGKTPYDEVSLSDTCSHASQRLSLDALTFGYISAQQVSQRRLLKCHYSTSFKAVDYHAQLQRYCC